MNIVRANKPGNWASRAASPVRLFALVLSLLLAQALGFMHGIEHAPRTLLPTVQSVPLQSTAADVSAGARSGWVTDLFAGHSEESTCQVFDQLSHGSALLGQALVVAPLTLASFFLDVYRGVMPPHQRSLIQARGPPAVFTAS